MYRKLSNRLRGREKVKEESISCQEVIDILEDLPESVKVSGSFSGTFSGADVPRNKSPSRMARPVEDYLIDGLLPGLVCDARHEVYSGRGKDKHYITMVHHGKGNPLRKAISLMGYRKCVLEYEE